MGGQYEDVIEKPRRASRAAPMAGQIGKIRFHENAGEVHFHDDKANRKVEVPTSVWSKAWQDLLDKAPNRWEYNDAARKTKLVVSTKSS